MNTNDSDIIKSMAADINANLRKEQIPPRIAAVVLATAFIDTINFQIDPKQHNEVTLYAIRMILRGTGIISKGNKVEFSF